MMKIKYLSISLIALVVLFAGCKNAAQYRDIVYMTGTETSTSTNFTIDSPSSLGVSVTASDKVSTDTKVTLKIQSDLLEAYNKLTGKTCQTPPEGSCVLDTNCVSINSGSNVSESAKLSVVSLDKFAEGVTYCVPISITSVEGDLSVLESSRTIFVVINRTIITQAVNLKGSDYFTVPSFQGNSAVSSLSQITMECRVYINSFQSNNPYISSLIGIEENFLLRFGDVSVEKNQLQLAGGKLAGGNKFPVTGSTKFSIGQWYHVAVVYNGSTMSLYVNGKLDSYTTASKGVIDFSDTYMDGFHIGYSERGRLLNGYVSEARVWTRALSAIELQNNLCYVDPTSKDLLAYWRFNAADSSGKVTDLTGHGYTAVGSTANLTWVTGIRCPN